MSPTEIIPMLLVVLLRRVEQERYPDQNDERPQQKLPGREPP